MIALSRNILTDLQVPQQNIGFEYFGAAPIDQPRSSSDAALVAFRQSGINVDIAAGESARSLLEVGGKRRPETGQWLSGRRLPPVHLPEAERGGVQHPYRPVFRYRRR